MKKKWLLVRKMRLAFSAALALLLVVGVMSYRNSGNQVETEEWVAHTHEVLATLAGVLSDETEAESARRGYFITSDSVFLRKYKTSAAAAYANLARVRQLTVDNASQQRRLDALNPLITRRLRLLAQLIDSQGNNPSDVAVQVSKTLEGEEIQTRVRDLLAEMVGAERILLQSRTAKTRVSTRLAIFTILLGTGLGLGFLGAGLHLLQREFSQRIRAEEALRASEVKFRGILESAPDAMVIADAQGRIVLLNAETERLFGYRRDELVGQPVEFLVPERFRGRHPQHRQGYTARPRTRSMGEGLDLRGLRKDASEFPVEISLSPLESAEGILVTAAIRDISVRKDAEKHLAQMENRYCGLLEAAPDAMVVVNQGGEIVLLNLQAEKQFGYHRDELLGQKVKNIIPEGFAERLIADSTRTAADALAQQIGTGIELYGRRKDGSDFPIEIMLSPLESAEGILVTAAIRDITERKKSEEHLVKTVGELRRSNDELQQFAYVASHDLQEPLRMVASYTQLLAKRYKGRLDSDADEFIAYAVDGSNRMQVLIQDLLAYSRAGTNGKALREISSENALKEALTNLRGTIEESGAIVTHDSLPAITTDDTQLAQVFQNLVGNAIKYRSPEVPHVHVSAGKNRGNEWIFSVRDNGLGIDPQYFERIFILFQRLHGRREFKGTGIGLAICKKILERLGGRIWVESQPAKGSTFYFALPERDGK
jgi:PAS domain S-box-containing protein